MGICCCRREYSTLPDNPEDFHIETPNFSQMAAKNPTQTDLSSKASKYPQRMVKPGSRFVDNINTCCVHTHTM
jgi:hypothetical protein